MDFFDCNAFFGRPAKPGPSTMTCPTVDDLLAQFTRAGVARALVWHVAQIDASPHCGNTLLADAIRPHSNLLGVWTLLPPQTNEMPLDRLFTDMKSNRIVALRAFPATHRYLFCTTTLGPLLKEMSDRRIPLLYSIRRNSPDRTAWQDLYNVLHDAPDLTVIITDHGSWGCDRYFRPLLEHFPRVFIDTTLYFIDGAIEDLVDRYGPARLLFGTGLPERFPGGSMLALRHAPFPDAAKADIAAGNLDRLIKEVRL